MAAVCPVCGKPAKTCLWTDVVKNKYDGRVFNYTEPLPYNKEAETFDVERMREILPYPKYELFSENPKSFTKSDLEKIDLRITGAYCTKCGARLKE